MSGIEEKNTFSHNKQCKMQFPKCILSHFYFDTIQLSTLKVLINVVFNVFCFKYTYKFKMLPDKFERGYDEK